jgi:phospholipid transport system substrate-binding protein
MKKGFTLIVGLLLLSSAVAAAEQVPTRSTGPMTAAAPANPAVALRAGVDRLIAFLNQDPAPDEAQLEGFLNDEIAPFFDFDYMAKTAGGRLFERLDDTQQADITAGIKRSFLGKMAEKLTGYSNQQVRFLPPRAGDGGRTAQVSVAILNPGSYPARLDFRLYRGGESWRVYDVAANGQSAIVHYRRQLARQVQERRMREMRAMARPAMPGGMGPAMGPGPQMLPPGRPPVMPPTGYGVPYPR